MSYLPTKVNEGSPTEFRTWLDDELRKISQAFNQTDNLDLVPIASEPARFGSGLLIYADGANFDPGSGEGVYYRGPAGWVFAGAAPGGGATLPPSTVTDSTLVGDGAAGWVEVTTVRNSASLIRIIEGGLSDEIQIGWNAPNESFMDFLNSTVHRFRGPTNGRVEFQNGTGASIVLLRHDVVPTRLELRDGYHWRISNTSDTDWQDNYHNGTNFISDHVNSVRWDVNDTIFNVNRQAGEHGIAVGGDSLDATSASIRLWNHGSNRSRLISVSEDLGIDAASHMYFDYEGTDGFPANHLIFGTTGAVGDILTIHQDSAVIAHYPIYGGDAAGSVLAMQGARTAAPDLGIVECRSPLELTYDTFSNTTPAQQFAMRWAPTVAIAGPYIGGALQVAFDFTVTTGVYVPATFSDTSIARINAIPGFAAHTFINCLNTIQNVGNFNLPAALVMNIGLVHARTTAGTSVTPAMTGISFSPQIRASISGAVMTRTEQTAVRVSPTHSTVFGATVNYGTVIGIDCIAPNVALFQTQSGTENITAYYGLRMNNITFGGAGRVVNAVRSELNAATNVRGINCTGTALNTMNGNLRFETTLVGCQYGAGQEWSEGYANGANFMFEQQTSPLGQWRKSFPTTTRMLFDWSANMELTINAQLGFSLGAQSGANGNQFGNFVAGAQTVTIGGEYSQFLLTQAGNVTVNANISAFGWTINAPTFTAGTGVLGTAAALNVGGNPNLGVDRIGVRIISNPSGGAGVNAALWVTAGLTKLDGDLDHSGTNLGFYGTAPIAKQLAVPVSAAGVHAALVALGLIT